MKRFLVTQSGIAQTSFDDVPAAALAEGEARLAIRRFALTANNVTYAAAGFAVGYWNFFPSGIEGQGLLPVWGFAEVTEKTEVPIWRLERGFTGSGHWPRSW